MTTVAATRPQARTRPDRGRSSARRRAAAIDLLFVAPTVALVTVFMLGPLGLAGYFSLTDWDGFSLNSPFVGLQNYQEVFADRHAAGSLTVTVTIALVCTVLVTGLALGLAALLKEPLASHSFYRGVFFYPHLIAAIAIGFAWNALLAPDGAVNSVLAGFGIEPLPFLVDKTWALASVIGVLVWQSTALSLVLFLAAMQAVPAELYETAALDGAGALRQLRSITIPSISATITVAVILQMASYLRVYELVLVMTGGGPAGGTQTIAYQILSIAYVNDKLGRGTAEAVMLFLVTMLLAVASFVVRRRRDLNL